MKKIISISILSIILLTSISCGGKNETSTIPDFTTQSAQEIPQSVADQKPAVVASSGNEGLDLITDADCLSCHKVDSKLIGPSYQDVAEKYSEKDIDQLAQKIIEGGKGNWGDIPMTPHTELSQENAKKMVKYILSLKK